MGRESVTSAGAVLDAMGDGVYTLDRRGRFLDVNDYLVELTGYDETELVGATPSKLLDEDDVDAFERAIRELVEDFDPGVATVEATLRTASGATVPIEANLTLLEGPNGLEGTTGVIRDVTEQRERERELVRYERFIEAADDAIYTLDAEGRYTSVNDRFVQQTGYSREKIIGSHVTMLVREEDVARIGDAVVETLERGESFVGEFEFPVEYADGDRRIVQGRLSVLPFEETFQGTVGIVRDITEQRERERQLRQQNERLDEFANALSHDLRNPLNVAMGQLSLVADDFESERLETATSALERMEDLIGTMLALAREGRVVSDPTPVDLAAVTRETWANTATADATLDGEPSLPTVLADPNRLSQLLQNLVRNAVEHGGTEVTVRVGALPDGFYVEDDGSGIPPADRETVFGWGETTADDGTGYGLAIVESIADAHGWTVRATAAEAGGARFEVTDVRRAEPTA